jgi:hypothetical protein
MKRLIGTILLVCSLSVWAHADARTLALYLNDPGRLSPESAQSMQHELKRLLAPAGIDVVWKNFADRKAGEDFALVAIGSVEGSCEPRGGNFIDGVRLADTVFSADGVLPYFNVDCTQLMRVLGSESSPSMVGRALARVMAHELYHILAGTTEHTIGGIAKAAFSHSDLTAPGLEFDAVSLRRMRRIQRAAAADSRSASAERSSVSAAT